MANQQTKELLRVNRYTLILDEVINVIEQVKLKKDDIKFLEKGGVTFDEAVEVYVCKIMAKSIIDEKTMDPYIKELYRNNVKVYKSEVPHVLYIGEILYHYVRES